jgi:uncharacterized protein YegJ (DUF2314 family)
MNDSRSSPVFLFDNSDPQMQEAYRKARATFRYFWREMAWERRRIVPALDLACVKAPFSDPGPAEPQRDHPDVEHMWLGDVDFDGRLVRGVHLNSPNWLKSVKAGDPAEVPLGEISDWMYAIGGEVYGAYTVHLMRSRMGSRERQDHDAAWGLHFGDPGKVRVAPAPEKRGGWLRSWFGRKSEGEAAIPAEHPMSEAMVASLEERLAEDPSMLHEKDERGWTLLHHQALAGSAATVRVLLERGANPNARTDHGMTPLQLAQSLGWDIVVALLAGKRGRALP